MSEPAPRSINASLRPTVEQTTSAQARAREHLAATNPVRPPIEYCRIMHSGGGTLSVEEAGAIGGREAGAVRPGRGRYRRGAFVAKAAGFADVITYDMGGTSTDVAVILDGQPQWTTASRSTGCRSACRRSTSITVGAGGGSIASLDAGGALRVGPRSAGAVPGPACYGRGGTSRRSPMRISSWVEFCPPDLPAERCGSIWIWPVGPSSRWPRRWAKTVDRDGAGHRAGGARRT